MSPEDRLQIAVAEFLDTALPADAIWWHTPNGGSRHVIEARKLKRMGVKAGIPDVIVLHCAETFFIELKVEKGTPSDAQRDIHARLRRGGFAVEVCRSVDEVEATLKTWGIPLRARIAA